MSTYFEDDYDGILLEDFVGIVHEIQIYFKDGRVGGWSSFYCKVTWNDETLENEADLQIFDLLLKIDIQNGADTSKIVYWLCVYGAFKAVKVRFRQIYHVIKKILLQILFLIFIYHQIFFQFKILGQVCFKSQFQNLESKFYFYTKIL